MRRGVQRRQRVVAPRAPLGAPARRARVRRAFGSTRKAPAPWFRASCERAAPQRALCGVRAPEFASYTMTCLGCSIGLWGCIVTVQLYRCVCRGSSIESGDACCGSYRILPASTPAYESTSDTYDRATQRDNGTRARVSGLRSRGGRTLPHVRAIIKNDTRIPRRPRAPVFDRV